MAEKMNVGSVMQNKYCGPWTVHSELACHPCAGAMLIFSVSFQFLYMSLRRGQFTRYCGSVPLRPKTLLPV
ncbi:hypothetical protein AG1IA_02478 [Rhizoctonia solani AG-1 IA]|uniref:Uncharacterized protein n=1 Tax=Thanatephorus cucumeris (strain AG1-IA) TaxID=983506 RepID=L8X317_THACA|nr:hypothetical protein AG1IA_02478 [Rhizoctonia solani AG-1 IA]